MPKIENYLNEGDSHKGKQLFAFISVAFVNFDQSAI